jgi:hypothetical protein
MVELIESNQKKHSWLSLIDHCHSMPSLLSTAPTTAAAASAATNNNNTLVTLLFGLRTCYFVSG